MKSRSKQRFSCARNVAALCVLAVAALTASPGVAAAAGNTFKFALVRSPALSTSAGCAPNASGSASIQHVGSVEVLNVRVTGLPPSTNFDLFVIQVPNKPFGMSWYQGDIDTNRNGVGKGKFMGRFNIETFVVAPGIADAPLTFDNAFPSVSPNPETGPLQMYHLGLWFNSPSDAANAGCPDTVTPFNGEHDAGVQILNTSNFPDLQGPLINVQ